MFCPRCGVENQAGSRYCVSCGSELPDSSSGSEPSSDDSGGLKGGLRRLVGTTPRQRMVTAGTAIALVVALVAFLVLAPADEEDPRLPQDASAKALDASCITHKEEIASAQQQLLRTGTLEAVSDYGDSLVPIVGEWKDELEETAVAADRAAMARALGAALLEVQIEAATFARAAREGNRRELGVAATRLDAATANAEAAIQSLELRRCGGLEIRAGQLVRQ